MSKKKLYYILIVLSIVLFTISMTVLNETTYIGPIVIVISIYLLLGSIVMCCGFIILVTIEYDLGGLYG